MENREKYKISISLNALNHLGIKLYSNIPSVLSEVVANAWDADAEDVEITTSKDNIVIKDSGQGMSLSDINDKYLTVGYDRRKDGCGVTPKFSRPVMGRKGIGKLSLFSIANKITIETVRNGEKNAFVLDAGKIEEMLIKKGGAEESTGTYHPEPVDIDGIDFATDGTRITITELKKNVTEGTNEALKKRLARRFSVLGAENNFEVKLNGDEIRITDRDYFHKVQYIWYFGEESKFYCDHCVEGKTTLKEERGNVVNVDGRDLKVTGWIGTVESSGDLKDGDDNLNKIVVMVRGKLAQEDMLDDFSEGGVYTKYLIGEIHADFLDEDDQEDIATTSRQNIIQDDPRYKALKVFVEQELRHIKNKWTDLRNDEGVKKAVETPSIKEWFSGLKGDNRKRAEKLLGKINQLTIDSDEERKTLFKHAILAFETLRYKQNLDALDSIEPGNLAVFAEIFSEHNDIEATLYHQITEGRIAVIRKLHEQVNEDALEKIVQHHLYDNLWLLDPSWDRATETPLMEEQVSKAFKAMQAKASKEEKEGRFDIKYKNTAGKHIIIELKRPGRKVSTHELLGQVDKYRDKLIELLRAAGLNEPVEVVCLVGEELTDWKNPEKREESARLLSTKNIRVVLYQELIENAYRTYSEYLKKSEESGRIFDLIKSIETS